MECCPDFKKVCTLGKSRQLVSPPSLHTVPGVPSHPLAALFPHSCASFCSSAFPFLASMLQCAVPKDGIKGCASRGGRGGPGRGA